MAVPTKLLNRIDEHLTRSEVFKAVVLYREAMGCGISEAKDFIGARFRERFPELWEQYDNLEGEDS